MKVIRQHHCRNDVEWPCGTSLAKCDAQMDDMVDEQSSIPIKQVDREEIGAAGHPYASIVGHARSMSASARTGHRSTTRRGARLIRRAGLDPRLLRPNAVKLT